MYSVYSPSTIEDSLLRWQQVCRWAQENDRYQQYQKDAVVSCESGWIYFVQRGVVRLHGHKSNDSWPNLSKPATTTEVGVISSPKEPTPSLLSLVGAGQPFELGQNPQIQIQAIAHTRNTAVLCVHARELSLVSGFEMDTLQAFRYQHQRQMLQINNLTQGRTIDQLLGYLHLLAEEFGEEDKAGLRLPFTLTHFQLAEAIFGHRLLELCTR